MALQCYIENRIILRHKEVKVYLLQLDETWYPKYITVLPHYNVPHCNLAFNITQS